MTRFLIAGEDISLAEELLNYFVDKYFTLEMPYFENFTVQSNALFSIRWIILGIAIGIIVAAISTIYNKRYLGDFVRLLIFRECFDASSAKTLSELECDRRPAIRNAIRSGGTLSRWVRCAEEDEFYESLEVKRLEYEKIVEGDKKAPKFKEPAFVRDSNSMHFYIPEDKRYKAEVKFDKKGTDLVSALIVIVIDIVLCALSMYFLTDVLTYVDNFITLMNGL